MVETRFRDSSDVDELYSEHEPDVVPISTRNGRRESEPHSSEVVQLHEVLTYNFPEHRILWDLHHLFFEKDDLEEIDIQFDISILKNISIPHELTSYKASEFGNRVPDVAINVLSRSTWRRDLLDIMEQSASLGIPIYIVYTPYHVATRKYRAPFMRVHKMNSLGRYDIVDIRKVACVEGETAISSDALVSLEPILPVKVGMELLKKLASDNKQRFRLALFKADSNERLLSEKECAKKRAEEEKKRAEEEKKRAEEEKKRAEEEKKRAEEEKKRADAYEELLKKHNIPIN